MDAGECGRLRVEERAFKVQDALCGHAELLGEHGHEQRLLTVGPAVHTRRVVILCGGLVLVPLCAALATRGYLGARHSARLAKRRLARSLGGGRLGTFAHHTRIARKALERLGRQDWLQVILFVHLERLALFGRLQVDAKRGHA